MQKRIREEREEDLLGALRKRGPELEERMHREKRSVKRKVRD